MFRVSPLASFSPAPSRPSPQPQCTQIAADCISNEARKVSAAKGDGTTAAPVNFPAFCQEFMLMRFGLKTVALKQTQSLITSVRKYMDKSLRCWMFARLAGISPSSTKGGSSKARSTKRGGGSGSSGESGGGGGGDAGAAGDGGTATGPLEAGAAAFFLRMIAQVFPKRHQVAAAFATPKAILVKKVVLFDLSRAVFVKRHLLLRVDAALSELAQSPPQTSDHREPQVDLDQALKVMLDVWPEEARAERQDEHERARAVVRECIRR